MKKILFLAISLFIFSNCKMGKEESANDTEGQDEVLEVIEPTKNPKADQDLLDPKQGVIVVFNKGMTETEDLIHENGLKIEKILFDQNSLKVGLIKVPADKKDYWLDKLIETGDFKDVKLYSDKNLNKLIENEKAKQKK